MDLLWYGLATDGSSVEDDKLLPVDKDSGLIAASLLDIPNINSGLTAQQLYDVCNEVREAFSLNWDNCITYSSDNSLLQKIRSVQVDQRFFTLVSLVI